VAEITIIIPALNEQAGIETFLQHLQLLRPQCELLLVDGGSDDDTVALAQLYVDNVLSAHSGRAVQMNIGAAMASAPILLFLHADTYLPEDAISQIQKAMNSGYQWGRFDVQLTGDHFLLKCVAKLMNTRSRWSGIATGDQAIFVLSKLFEQRGGYADIALMEDIELSARLKKVSKPFCARSKVTSSGRRWLNFGILRTITLMWWLRLQYFIGAKPERLALLYKEGKFWKV
tara:strand:- start:82358 stop:83050 length:693 start_codon:yes stop_codon:yes gene_type:complete